MTPMSKYDQYRETITKRYQAGESYAKIAADYGCHGSSIRNAILEWGVPVIKKTWSRNPKSKGLMNMADAETAKLVQRYTSGETMEALAAELGVAVVTVWKKIHDAGIDARDRGPYREKSEDGTQMVCNRCNRMQALDAFHNSSRDGKVAYCKDCQREMYWERMYNFTGDQYREMLAAQNYRCAICKCTPDSQANAKKRYLSVDHDHVTLKVRSLLCSACNSALGHARDDAALATKMAEYLAQHADKQETKRP